MAASLHIKGIRKVFGKGDKAVEILKRIDIDVATGEFLILVGPSGCGKSTLLSIGGRVVNDVPPAERGIAMVFQSYALYPHMNLYDNMAFGLQLARMPKDEIDRAVKHAAKPAAKRTRKKAA